MRNIIKNVWKYIMYFITKIYIGFDVYLINKIEKIPKSENTYSQFGQDMYVFEKIFNKKQNGFFVDIGANHPIKCNNTYLFELNNWTGLAIEPQDHLRILWPDMRKTTCLNYVIGPENKQVAFIEGQDNEDGLSGIKDFNKVSEDRQKETTKEQKRLDQILKDNNIEKIDYLSIDVEGYEMNVLESIDFNTVNIKVIGIENDLGFNKIPIIGKKLGSELGNNNIRKFLKSKGYTHKARIICDDFFVKM